MYFLRVMLYVAPRRIIAPRVELLVLVRMRRVAALAVVVGLRPGVVVSVVVRLALVLVLMRVPVAILVGMIAHLALAFSFSGGS